MSTPIGSSFLCGLFSSLFTRWRVSPPSLTTLVSEERKSRLSERGKLFPTWSNQELVEEKLGLRKETSR